MLIENIGVAGRRNMRKIVNARCVNIGEKIRIVNVILVKYTMKCFLENYKKPFLSHYIIYNLCLYYTISQMKSQEKNEKIVKKVKKIGSNYNSCNDWRD